MAEDAEYFSGETSYFREWSLLVAYLLAKLQTFAD